MKVFTVFSFVALFAFGCGSESACGGYCSTACNKFAFCDSSTVYTDADIKECKSVCLDTIKQGQAGFGTGSVDSQCSTAEEQISPMSCDQFASFLGLTEDTAKPIGLAAAEKVRNLAAK